MPRSLDATAPVHSLDGRGRSLYRRALLERAAMTDSNTTDAPIMLRADITREELAQLKIAAINAGMTVQQLLGLLVRDRIAKEAT